MPQLTIPTTDCDLVLKQVSLGQLNELGRAAMHRGFTGFVTEERFKESQIEKYIGELSSLAPGVKQVFDPGQYRRFAGDSMLSRGRYYTVAIDPKGDDSGTLVRELRSYYSPKQAGIIQVFDSAVDADVFRRLALPTPSLALVFLPIRKIRNVFSTSYSKDAVPLIVQLPLSVESRRLQGIVDLRDPTTARRFAEELGNLEWDVRGVRTKSFPLRPPLDSFSDLIPALLEQSLGGGGLSNLIGTWLRKIGAEGLIFPSARVDAGVHCRDGAMVSSSGWNFVDYSNSKQPFHDAFIDLGTEWPRYVQQTPEGPHEDMTPVILPSVTIEYQRDGENQGSWAVHGLRAAREALWRYSMVMECIEKISDGASQDAISLVQKWLTTMFLKVYPKRSEDVAIREADAKEDVKVLGATSMIVQEAIMGLPERVAQLREYAQHISSTYSELGAALMNLMSAASRFE